MADVRHVVMISIDALRFDAVRWQPDQRYWAALGIDPRLNTPTMDALAAESVRFTRCVSNAGYTPLSHATIFTGSYAHRHGVVNFLNTTCNPDVPTVTEMFSRAGYRTLILAQPSMQKLFCDVNASLRQVDERYDNDTDFLAAMHRHRDRKVFAFLHLCDVHDPLVRGGEVLPDITQGLDWELFLRLVYNATPAGPDTTDVILPDGRRINYNSMQGTPVANTPQEIKRHLQRLFQAYLYGVGKFDRHRFKNLIDTLRAMGVWDRTLMAVFSDHGEGQYWAQPWRLMHGATTEETIIRTPLLLKIPGQSPRQVNQLVGLVDLLPTVTEAAGVEPAGATFDGCSLFPTIREDRPAGQEYWIENWSHSPNDGDPHIMARAIRRADGRKYIWNGFDIDWGQLESLPDNEFEDKAARVTYGNPPSEWLRGEIRKLVQQQGRTAAVRTLLTRCRPAHVILDNVDDDLTESKPLIVNQKHPRWAEYAAYRQRMIELTATPRIASALDQAEEEKLKQRLRDLGYL